jgi:subtilisin family serine protease
MAFHISDPNIVLEEDAVDVLIETVQPGAQEHLSQYLKTYDYLTSLDGTFVSAHLSLGTAERLVGIPDVRRINLKKESRLHLQEAATMINLFAPAKRKRTVSETGKGVLIGIVDSGFDLSHPMFRDGHGKLRVAGLLDQTAHGRPQAYTSSQLEERWAPSAEPDRWTSTTKPGIDHHGHGTHVASIAGGTLYRNYEGVAPGAEFLLVKADLLNTDTAVAWIFEQADKRPCVINLSLGHHWGAHDGTNAEERLYTGKAGPGKIIVVSAGNEREEKIHLGGIFFENEVEYVPFELLPQANGTAMTVLTCWYDRADMFSITVTTPTGQSFTVPDKNTPPLAHQQSNLDFLTSCKDYRFNNLVQVEIQISLANIGLTTRSIRWWQLEIRCTKATHGRLDAWFNNSGFARFGPHRFIEESRTIGLPATSIGVISVASHVSKSVWDADAGQQSDYRAVKGVSSVFSSMGPTRDGRRKPEASAPGEYITAALAEASGLASNTDRSLVQSRLLTLEGTSMAAPVITGITALLLQKRPTLTPDLLRQILPQVCTQLHPGSTPEWNPVYGYGSINVAKAIDMV